MGFEKAEFKTIWANEFDKNIWDMYRYNFKNTFLDTRSIRDIYADAIPCADGIIGGPPCQSWSEAGELKGIEDERGQLFFEYVRILETKKPLFYLLKTSPASEAVSTIIAQFSKAGYVVNHKLLNARDYGVPQDRQRVICVGYRKDLGMKFEFPAPHKKAVTFWDAIGDLAKTALPAGDFNRTRGDVLVVPNHEYMHGSFSIIYMSRNRLRAWDKPIYDPGGWTPLFTPKHRRWSKSVWTK